MVFTECESVFSFVRVHWICMAYYYTMFVMICLLSSSVKNAAVDLGDMMLSQSFSQNREIKFLLKVKARSVTSLVPYTVK